MCITVRKEHTRAATEGRWSRSGTRVYDVFHSSFFAQTAANYIKTIRRMINVLSVDVEEYFHPSEVQRHIDPTQWDSLPSRIDSQVSEVLDLFQKQQTKATFFILGWVAEHHPQAVSAIVAAGHEIGCHSYAHELVYRMTPAQFRRDTQRAIAAIEDACGVSPRVYRAPSYSITRQSFWALEVLAECGFTHDSSIYPITHDRYGIAGFERHPHVIETPSGPIHEFPIATVQLANQIAPVGGGAYLRLLPARYISAGIRRVNREEQKPVCIYFHPWEIDPGLPHLARGLISRARTYTGIRGMSRKLDRLLSEFQFSTLTSVQSTSVRRNLQIPA
jgi:polysaccharide deacetylase family protein (PEP-CTERM system associated)